MMFAGDIEDRVSLHELNASYAHHLSSKALSDLLDLWDHDAQWIHPKWGILNGREEFREIYSEGFQRLSVIHSTASLGSLKIDRREATGRTWINEVAVDLEGKYSHILGYYDDIYTKDVRAGWIFLKRIYIQAYRTERGNEKG